MIAHKILMGGSWLLIGLCCCTQGKLVESDSVRMPGGEAGRSADEQIHFFRPPNGRARTLNVRDFGAVPDDGKDDTKALNDAVGACCKRTPSRLVFVPGRYDLQTKERDFALRLKGRDIEVLGNGALLMFHGMGGGILIHGSENVAFRNLTFDWERPPFCPGYVVAATPRSLDIKIDPYYPVTGEESVRAILEYDANTKKLKRRGLDVYDAVDGVSLVEPQVLRLTLKWDVPFKPGMLLTLRHVIQDHVLSIMYCTNLEFEDITVHAAGCMGLAGHHSENLLLRRFNVCIRPDSDRLMSTNADATHFVNCAGDILIEDCFFEGMGDDATNVHGIYVPVVERVGSHTIRIDDPGNWRAPSPTDNVEFIRRETLLPYAQNTVKSIDHDPATHATSITFVKPLPAEMRLNDLIANSTRTPHLHIRNCTVRNNRARGFLVKTRGALIENNRFEECSGPGMLIITDCAHWYESIGTRGVTVRNNLFRGCNYGTTMTRAALNISAHVKDWRLAPKPGIHRDILVEGNRIESTDNSAIYVACAENVTIRNNQIRRCCQDPTDDWARAAIFFQNARNATVSGNTLTLEQATEKGLSAVIIGPGCQRETIEITGNTGF